MIALVAIATAAAYADLKELADRHAGGLRGDGMDARTLVGRLKDPRHGERTGTTQPGLANGQVDAAGAPAKHGEFASLKMRISLSPELRARMSPVLLSQPDPARCFWLRKEPRRRA